MAFIFENYVEQFCMSVVLAGIVVIFILYFKYCWKFVFKYLAETETYKMSELQRTFDTSSTGAEIIAQVLKSHGVEFIFYLCGGSVTALAVEADKAGIRIIDTRHENTAASAAMAVGRITGTPGVVLVTSGPGLTNTITAVQTALSEATPMIVFSGAVQTITRGIGDLQDIDQVGIMKKVCKASYSIERKTAIVKTLQQAFHQAVSNTPGPIYVQLPLDILRPPHFDPLPILRSAPLTSYWNSTMSSFRSVIQNITARGDSTSVYAPLHVTYPKASPAEIHKSVKLIQASKKPLLIVGTQGTLRPKKIHQVTKALEDLGIPCFTIFTAHGLLPPSHKLLMNQGNGIIAAQKEADLVILAGVTCDFTLRHGLDLPRSGAVISANRSKENGTLNAGKYWSLSQFLQSDVGYYLVRLARALKKQQYEVPENWIATLRERNTQYELFLKKKKLEQSNGLLNPLALLAQVNKTVVIKDVVWVFDQGDFVNTAGTAYITPQTPLSWIDSLPFAGVGGSAGFALGAKLCNPDREVWCIAGDGSCSFTIMDFDTFKRHKVHVIFVIGNDSRWGEICRKQEEDFQTTVGCSLEYSKYHEIATTLGGTGILVDKSNEGDLAKILKEASNLSRTKSVLLNILIGKTDIRDGHL